MAGQPFSSPASADSRPRVWGSPWDLARRSKSSGSGLTRYGCSVAHCFSSASRHFSFSSTAGAKPRGNWLRLSRPHRYCELNLGGSYVEQREDDRSSLSKLHQRPVGQEFFWRNVPCLRSLHPRTDRPSSFGPPPHSR